VYKRQRGLGDVYKRQEEGREKIGKWIVKELKLTPKLVEKLEPWALSCQ
jgi:hypothetical protein